MRRFNLVTENGEAGDSLGVTFFRGTRQEVRRGVFQSADELETFWNEAEHAMVMDGEGWQGTLSELRDAFRNFHTADLAEMTARGWADRMESGLNWRTCANAEGETFLTR